MSLHHSVVSVIGMDQPGIVAALCDTLTKHQCNIAEMTQSNLRNQFAGVFIVEVPDDVENAKLQEKLLHSTRAEGLNVTVEVRPLIEAPADVKPKENEPFVVSVYGKDRNDIVGTFAKMFAKHRVNIEDLRALQPEPEVFMIVYEILIPVDTDLKALHRDLLDQAKAMGLNLTMQHRKIFEAVHRIQVV